MNDRHVISPYPIRMPVDLREKLESKATLGNRSLHAEIIARLQSSFDQGLINEEKKAEFLEFMNEAIDERIQLNVQLKAMQRKQATERSKQNL